MYQKGNTNMKRVLVVFVLGCLMVCQAHRDSHDDDSPCECDDDKGKHHNKRRDHHCDCSGNKDTQLYCIVIASVAVGVAGIAVGCCVYQKKCKKKRTMTHPEQHVTYITMSEPEGNGKKPLPDDIWTKTPPSTQPLSGNRWTTMHPSAPPPYSTLPHYQPESRETVLSPPPPYAFVQ